MNAHVYIQQAGDRAVIAERLSSLTSLSKADLIDNYNKAQIKGFFGVHRQVLFIIALNITFNKRFAKSPIKVTDNSLIEFTQPIVLAGESWGYVQ